MISFKETLNESKREVFDGIDAIRVYKEIENSPKQDVMTDDEGLEQRAILTKQGMYIVYFDYEDAPMTVIKNPSKKDMLEFKAALLSN